MSQTKANLIMEAPKNWLKMVENIRLVRKKYPAPVDSMGCDQVDKADKNLDQRFYVLVSLMLSSQTKDPITWAAVQKLKANGICNIEGLLTTPEKDIEDLIHPVGFYRRKAVYLKKTAAILKEHFNGDIPDSIQALCALPGVGPKMAHLCMQEAWNVNSGIGVDTHVHRISARLGWVPTKHIKTPEDTRMALESWMPSDYWREINHLLVGFGQTICTPLHPKCSECANNEICPSSSVKANATINGASPKKKPPKTTKSAAATKKVKLMKVEEPGQHQQQEEEEEQKQQTEKTDQIELEPSKPLAAAQPKAVVVKLEAVNKQEPEEATPPARRTRASLRASRASAAATRC